MLRGRAEGWTATEGREGTSTEGREEESSSSCNRGRLPCSKDFVAGWMDTASGLEPVCFGCKD